MGLSTQCSFEIEIVSTPFHLDRIAAVAVAVQKQQHSMHLNSHHSLKSRLSPEAYCRQGWKSCDHVGVCDGNVLSLDGWIDLECDVRSFQAV